MANCQRGIAYIEFSIMIPMLIIFMLGALYTVDSIRVTEKIESALSNLTEITAQLAPTAQTSDMHGITNAIPIMFTPVKPQKVTFIITDVATGPAVPAIPQIVWQVIWDSTNGIISNSSSFSSLVGQASNLPFRYEFNMPCPLANLHAALPNLAPMGNNSEIIVGEAFFNYRPIVATYGGSFGVSGTYRATFFSPRNGSLANVGFSTHCMVV